MGNKKRRLLFSLQSSKVNGNQDSLVKTSTESNTLGRDHQPMAVGGKSDADQKSEVISPVWIGVLIAGSILIIVIIAAIVIFRIRNKSKSNNDISKSNAERSNDGGDSTEDASAAVKQRQKQAATEHERELSNILSKRSTPFKAPTDKSCVPHDDPQYQTLYEVPDMDKILRMSDMPSKTTKV